MAKEVETQEGSVPLGAAPPTPALDVAYSSPYDEQMAKNAAEETKTEVFRTEDWAGLPNFSCPLCGYGTLDGDLGILNHAAARHPGTDMVEAQKQTMEARAKAKAEAEVAAKAQKAEADALAKAEAEVYAAALKTAEAEAEAARKKAEADAEAEAAWVAESEAGAAASAEAEAEAEAAAVAPPAEEEAEEGEAPLKESGDA